MNVAVAEAVRAYPELQYLRDLREVGWQCLWPATEDGVPGLLGGVPVQLDCFRAWPNGWMDVIRIRDRGDMVGIRLDADMPPGLVWERTGSLVEVIEGLLMLPPPGDRLAPRLVIGRAPVLWVPTA